MYRLAPGATLHFCFIDRMLSVLMAIKEGEFVALSVLEIFLMFVIIELIIVLNIRDLLNVRADQKEELVFDPVEDTVRPWRSCVITERTWNPSYTLYSTLIEIYENSQGKFRYPRSISMNFPYSQITAIQSVKKNYSSSREQGCNCNGSYGTRWCRKTFSSAGGNIKDVCLQAKTSPIQNKPTVLFFIFK
ncbi:hypothetical protein RB195_008451 [Necator americanus]|uniref:Uncharacterized protein n=1 Tax=Necator americanus TaxID=51031 RepID=A0ABR1CNR8_NECAM